MGSLKKRDYGVYAYDTNTMQYMKAKSDTGIYITKVIEKAAAEKSGIKEDDIVLSIDGQKLERMCELRRYIYTKKPKDEVTLKILRNNREMEVKAKLEKK